jgi:hypothetical protein
VQRRKLERWLRDEGARRVRHGSRHDWWETKQGRASVPRHREVNTITARAICKQLGVRQPPER